MKRIDAMIVAARALNQDTGLRVGFLFGDEPAPEGAAFVFRIILSQLDDEPGPSAAVRPSQPPEPTPRQPLEPIAPPGGSQRPWEPPTEIDVDAIPGSRRGPGPGSRGGYRRKPSDDDWQDEGD